jgi:hypothetical protein
MKIWVIEPDEACSMTLLKDRIRRMDETAAWSTTVRSGGLIREEKRLYPRIPCFLLVDYVLEGCAYRAFVKDLSADGAFIEAPKPVQTDTELALVIYFLEKDHPVKLAGEVVRGGQKGFGVKFNHLAECEFDRSVLLD